jgi:hypothetical protein
MAGNSITLRFAGDERDLVRATDRVGAATQDMAEEVDRSSSRIGQAFSGLGDKLKGASLAAGAVAGAALAGGLLSAVESEAGTDKLAARLGLDAEEHERLGGVAGSLYADAYGDSLTTVNNAVEGVYASIEGMATASAEELELVTAAAINFGSAMDIDVARAAEVAGRAVTTGLAGSATEAFDLLTVAAQKVAPELREPVLDAIDEYGQFFATLGIGGEQAFGTLVAAAEMGQFGIDKIGDALKEGTILMTDMSTGSVAAYESIGLSAQQMANDILAGGDTANAAFNKTLDGLLGITDPAEQAAAAIALFGTPLEDLNVSEIPAFLASMRSGEDALGDVAGASAGLGDTLNGNASTALTSFYRSAKLALTEELARALPTITKVGEFLQKYSGYIVPIVAGLAGFAIAVQAVTFAVKLWQAATVVATGVQWLYNVALSANPIGLVILAIGALIAAIVLIATKTDWFQRAWSWTWDKIKMVGRLGAEGFMGYMRMYGAVFEWVVGRARWVWDVLKFGFNSHVEFISGLPARIRSAASGAWDGLKDAFRNALNWIIWKWNSLSFTLPSIEIFGQRIGGGTISTPDLPYFHTGGIVSGAMGSETLAVLQAGERVTPAGGGGTPLVLEIKSGGSRLDDVLVEILARAVRDRGGRASVLGITG